MTSSLKIVTIITHSEIGTRQHDGGKTPGCERRNISGNGKTTKTDGGKTPGCE